MPSEKQETRFPKHQPPKKSEAAKFRNHLVGEDFRNRWFSEKQGEIVWALQKSPKISPFQERSEDRYRSENLQSDLFKPRDLGISTWLENPVEKVVY